MSQVRAVLYVNSILLMILGAAMGLPALVDAVGGYADWQAFLAAGMTTLFVGGLLYLANRQSEVVLGVRGAFVLTVSAWVMLSAFAALPFLFSNLGLNYADAFFEAISGLTTTGSTVLVGLDAMPPGLLLWRALLQWLGGIGIVVTAVALFPFLRVGGMQLFRTESSDRSDKVVPRPEQFAKTLGLVYGTLSLTCMAAYWLAGMPAFDALTHAMTTVATGGFSTRDLSFAEFGPLIQIICVLFMILGALPFVLYIGWLRGSHMALWQDSQVRAFLTLLAGAIAVMALWVWSTQELSIGVALVHVVFNVTSIVTTTGFASMDYQLWGGFAVIAFFALTFVGGCTGSTSGGIKIFRFQVMLTSLRIVLRRLTLPHGVFPPRYQGRPLSEDVINSAMTFIFAFLATVGMLTLALAALGLDFITSLSGAATAVANVGPGLGPVIGLAGNFAPLPDAAKWLLSLGMLLGRLELFTVMVLLTPSFWRQ